MNIFITGGTGFLGSNLIKRLVEQGHHIYALVRNVKKFEALVQTLKVEHRANVHPVEGELTKALLGVESPKLQSLIGQIDAVYHTAALLSFDENDREASFEMNIEGTKRVLDFAELVQAKTFFHVSTAYTLGNRTEGIESLYPLQSMFINSYEESKCHAEHLVMSASDRFDVMIMRPAIIIGDSETGEADTTFGLYGILRTIELLKKKAKRKPDQEQEIFHLLMEKDSVSNIVPVDYVTKVLALGLVYGKSNTVYNITNPAPPANKEVLDTVKEAFDFHSVEITSYEQKDRLSIREQKMNEPLEVFKDYLNRSIVFQDDNTRELLQQGKEEHLRMDKDMLLRIVHGFQKRNGKKIDQVLVSQ